MKPEVAGPDEPSERAAPTAQAVLEMVEKVAEFKAKAERLEAVIEGHARGPAILTRVRANAVVEAARKVVEALQDTAMLEPGEEELIKAVEAFDSPWPGDPPSKEEMEAMGMDTQRHMAVAANAGLRRRLEESEAARIELQQRWEDACDRARQFETELTELKVKTGQLIMQARAEGRGDMAKVVADLEGQRKRVKALEPVAEQAKALLAILESEESLNAATSIAIEKLEDVIWRVYG